MISRKIGDLLLPTRFSSTNRDVEKESERSQRKDESELNLRSEPSSYSNIERDILENGHIHTTHSDGESPIYYLVAEAAAIGLKDIGFTDHWDPLGISDRNYNQKCPAKPFEESYNYRREALKDFKTDHEEDGHTFELNIAEGAELEYFLGYEEDLEEEIEKAEFDYLYLSVHKNKEGEDYRNMEPSTQEEAIQIIGSYFRDLREAYAFADQIESIKVIGHPDGIERNGNLEGFFEDQDMYKDVLREEYESIIDEASENDVLSELNGRILLRDGESEWFNALCESDVSYATGTDTHRAGAKDEYDWVNETQARINILEMKLPELGRSPEPVLQDIDGYTVELPDEMPRSVELDRNPREKIK